MRAFLKLLKQIITAGSGVSSKRVCGLLGWVILLACLGYATWNSTELPLVTPDFIFGTIILLGVDSVTAIWKKTPAGVTPDPEPEPDLRGHKPPHPGPPRNHFVDADKAIPNDPDPAEPGSLNNAQL